ncbi:MAG: ATP-binding cassette domain-containing protein [Deltaproteobacteria bacterium]|nr:ATP-binding cassette domain-containing protein [Deltaproteobacteria bacterium]
MRTMVKLSGVEKTFNSLKVIKNLNFWVLEGEVVSLIGLSGCGKSTTLRIVANLEKTDKGTINRGFKRLAFIFREYRFCIERSDLE